MAEPNQKPRQFIQLPGTEVHAEPGRDRSAQDAARNEQQAGAILRTDQQGANRTEPGQRAGDEDPGRSAEDGRAGAQADAGGKTSEEEPAFEKPASGFDQNESFKEAGLTGLASFLVSAVRQTAEMQSFLALLTNKAESTHICFNAVNLPEKTHYGQTKMFVLVDGAFWRIDTCPAEVIAKIHRESQLMIRIDVNLAKRGQPLRGGEPDEVVGSNEILNTLAHELAAHATRFRSISKAVKSGATGDALDDSLVEQTKKGGPLDDDLAHRALLEGTSPEYEALQAKIVALIPTRGQALGLDQKRYQRDIARDRVTQAIHFDLEEAEGVLRVRRDRLLQKLGTGGVLDQVDYQVLLAQLATFFDEVADYQTKLLALHDRYEQLENDDALAMTSSKAEQVSGWRTEVTNLMAQDIALREATGQHLGK